MKLSEQFTRFGSDKNTEHHYGPIYDELVGDWVPKNILELGILAGASLKALEAHYATVTVWGFDKEPCAHLNKGRIKTIQGHIPDFVIPLQGVMLDFVIDDCSHKLRDQLIAIPYLWPNLKSGGLYFVEDVRSPEYLPHFECFPVMSVHDVRVPGGTQDDLMVVLKKP